MRVGLALVVLRIEVTGDDHVGRRIRSKNRVESFAEGLGVEAAGLLGIKGAGSGFPVVDENGEGMAFNLELHLKHIARVRGGMALHRLDRELAEQAVLVALFVHSAVRGGHRREVGCIGADCDLVARHSLIAEILEEQSLRWQAADLVIQVRGQHFFHCGVFVFL